jgi:hypothetical protein
MLQPLITLKGAIYSNFREDFHNVVCGRTPTKYYAMQQAVAIAGG